MNQCDNNSPSKLEGVAEGRGRVLSNQAISHTPPSLRDTSPNLGEELFISDLFSPNLR